MPCRRPRPLHRVLLNLRVCADHARENPLYPNGYRERAYCSDQDREMFRVRAKEVLAEALAMVRRADARQLSRWLSSTDAFVRAFVLEHLDQGTPA